jgi:lipoprotein-releasing system permease protein
MAMDFSFRLAKRYLFSRKKMNAINVITGISVLGLTIGSAALILVLSVFNGFEELISGMYSHFDPDLKVLPQRGKTFAMDEQTVGEIEGLPGIEYVSKTLEEVAFFDYGEKQNIGVIKGVDSNFHKINGMDSMVREGQYILQDGPKYNAVVGVGMRNKLGISIDDDFSSLSVFIPKNGIVRPLESPFRSRVLHPSGTFIVQQEFDNKYILADISVVRDLLRLAEEVSAVEIGIEPQANPVELKGQVQDKLEGRGLLIQTREEQQAAFIKLMKIEKWLAFAIAGFMLLLIAFNLTGALWMVVLEKKKDIAILYSMGATSRHIRNIFLIEGVLLSILGIVAGFTIALLVFGIQKLFGIVSIPGNFVIDAYPSSLKFIDFVVVAITVFLIGFTASILPAIKAGKVTTLIREE